MEIWRYEPEPLGFPRLVSRSRQPPHHCFHHVSTDCYSNLPKLHLAPCHSRRILAAPLILLDFSHSMQNYSLKLQSFLTFSARSLDSLLSPRPRCSGRLMRCPGSLPRSPVTPPSSVDLSTSADIKIKGLRGHKNVSFALQRTAK